MTRVLVLGGTGWLGRRIALAAREQGAEVVCVARGESGHVPADIEWIRTDRRTPGAYEPLDGAWDEVIELSYELDLVQPALDALADRAAHWTLISTVSVYSDNCTPHADETASLVDPDDLSRYPDAKVAAEQASWRRLQDRLLVARPGLIAGPGDPSDRLGYWLARLRRGGRVLRPATSGRFVQFIDVDDLAKWIQQAGGVGLTGAIDVVGAVHTMDDFFAAVRAATGFDGELIEVSDDALRAQGVGYWAGPRSLPLWLPLSDQGFTQRRGAAFRATGGNDRPLSETLERTLADEIERGVNRLRRSGLTPADEDAVLAATA